MTYRAPVADIAFTLKHGAGPRAALGAGRRTHRRRCRRGAGGGRPVRDRRAGAAQRGRRQATARRSRTAPITMPPGWKEAYRGLGRRRLERGLAARAMGRPGAAACAQRRLHRDVEFGLDGVRHRPGADHGRGRSAGELRHATSSSRRICPSSSPANGWARCSSPSRRPAPTSARCAPRPSAPATAAIASPGRRSSSPTASTTSPTTSSISCWRGCPMRRPATRASRCSWCRSCCVNEDGSLGARNDVRAHSIEHKLGIHASPTCTMVYGDQRRRGRLSGRRGEPRPRLHVHHDEPRPPRGRPAGRRHRRARDPAGAAICARAQAGPRARRDVRLERRSSSIPTSSAC